jgi:hypothetical protein
LRKELKEEVNVGAKIKSIEALHANSERHLKHTQDDGGLHLQTVLESQQVSGLEPSRVHPKGIDTVKVDSFVMSLRESRIRNGISSRRL